MDDLRNDPRYPEARRHARSLRGFYIHASVFVLVNAALMAFNFIATPARLWFGWATIGWGIGLAAHGLSVFAFRGWFGAQWEERKIREYLERH